MIFIHSEHRIKTCTTLLESHQLENNIILFLSAINCLTIVVCMLSTRITNSTEYYSIFFDVIPYHPFHFNSILDSINYSLLATCVEKSNLIEINSATYLQCSRGNIRSPLQIVSKCQLFHLCVRHFIWRPVLTTRSKNKSPEKFKKMSNQKTEDKCRTRFEKGINNDGSIHCQNESSVLQIIFIIEQIFLF